MARIVIDEAFLQQIESLQTLLKNNVGGSPGGNRKSRSYGSSAEFADHREYVDGDDTTKINWRIFPRRSPFGSWWSAPLRPMPHR